MTWDFDIKVDKNGLGHLGRQEDWNILLNQSNKNMFSDACICLLRKVTWYISGPHLRAPVLEIVLKTRIGFIQQDNRIQQLNYSYTHFCHDFYFIAGHD